MLISIVFFAVLDEIDDHRQARRQHRQRIIDDDELPSVNGADAPPDDDGDDR